MMERAERSEWISFGVALIAHIALVIALKHLLDNRGMPPAVPAMEVSFVEDVALVSSAPASDAAPAPAVGEEIGPIEEAAGASAAASEPEAAPPEPERVPSQSFPRDRPEEPRRTARSNVPSRPQPAVRSAQQAPPRPPRPQPQARPSTQGRGQAPRSQGSVLDRLSREFGRGPATAPGKAPNPQGAVVTSQVRASLDQAILRALQPCQRQTLPASEAQAIRVRVAVTLNPDGSLATARVAGVNDYDDSLRRYEQRMREVALNVVRQCTPIRGLPSEFYAVARGWRQFNYTFPRS